MGKEEEGGRGLTARLGKLLRSRHHMSQPQRVRRRIFRLSHHVQVESSRQRDAGSLCVFFPGVTGRVGHVP